MLPGLLMEGRDGGMVAMVSGPACLRDFARGWRGCDGVSVGLFSPGLFGSLTMLLGGGSGLCFSVRGDLREMISHACNANFPSGVALLSVVRR